VIVVGQGPRELYRKAFGYKSLVPAKVRMTVDTIFDIASLTKVIVTTPAIMMLNERGTISLDAPLSRYLEEFQDRPTGQATIRQLLLHTSGLPDLPPPKLVAPGFPHAAAGMARLELMAPPGRMFRYSDVGFMLLAEVARRVSDQRVDRFIDKQFFRPLGMRDSTFNPCCRMMPRIAPTEVVDGRLLRGEVHDGNARLLGGVAGHAGLFSTASDLSRFVQMLLNGGRGNDHQVLKASTVNALFTPVQIGEVARGLGWDMSSPFSRTLGSFFPAGSVGHTGFTGPALWIDPGKKVYLLILTNRVHPNGKGEVAELRMRVAAAVAKNFYAPPEPASGVTAQREEAPVNDSEKGGVLSGLDVLENQQFTLLAGRRVGLVTNQNGVNRQGQRAIDLFSKASNVRLKAIFTPEHGLSGLANDTVPSGREAVTGLPVWSLYGQDRRPTSAMLEGIDTLVVDLQDVGVRFYTYLTTLTYILEEAAARKLTVIVLDRPNPINGLVVEGPLLDPDLRSFTAPYRIPVRTGLTIGEYARLVVKERELPVRLTVVAMNGWTRRHWYDDTGLPWVNPSPNIRSVTGALLYAGIGVLEATNLSVGRGTDWPFEVVGAPWIDSTWLADAMNAQGLPGVRFSPISFTPSADRYAGSAVNGVRIEVTDREQVRAVSIGLTLANLLRRKYPEFRPEPIQNLLMNRYTFWGLVRGLPLPKLLAVAEAERSRFLERRAAILLYP
jgi:uncharacterized protein YbbC (DUF1343 family)/CubicO group peptidase (beta-lactamase class C family)